LELFGHYFSIGEKRRGSKVKKEGKLTFCYTKFISIHILFEKKKKKREKNSCQIFPSRTKLPCHELLFLFLFLFLFPQINKKEKEQRKGYSLSSCFQKLSREEYHLSL